MMIRFLAFVFVVFAATTTTTTTCALDSSECDALGFDSNQLRCSSCDKLSHSGAGAGLVDECRQCCSEHDDSAGNDLDSIGSDKNSNDSPFEFSQVLLRVQRDRLEGDHANVFHFVENELGKYRCGGKSADECPLDDSDSDVGIPVRLKVVRWTQPVLFFLDDEGHVLHSQSLIKWKTEHIVSYLAEHGVHRH
jgi:hypothetical protein